MLTLTRKIGERIWIGPDIVIELHSIKSTGSACQVAIDCPRDVRIVRGEVRDGWGPEVRGQRSEVRVG